MTDRRIEVKPNGFSNFLFKERIIRDLDEPPRVCRARELLLRVLGSRISRGMVRARYKFTVFV